MRLPHANRASMQHAGDGAWRLSLWRLLAPRAAAILERADRRRAADRLLLADLSLRVGGDLRRAALLDRAPDRGGASRRKDVAAVAHAHDRRNPRPLEQVVALLQIGPEPRPLISAPRRKI